MGCITVEIDSFGGERRRGPRIPLSGELVIFVESTGQFLERHGKDISEGGMFLESPAPPPAGTRLRFLIQPAGGSGLIRGLAEVAWRRETDEGPGRPAGMGLRFLSMNPEGQALIRRLVAERATVGETQPPPTARPEEPFSVESEPAPPQHPVDDVFEEAEAPPDATPDRRAAGDRSLGKPAATTAGALSDIGRPYAYDEHRASRSHRRAWLSAALVITGIVVLVALAARYSGRFGPLWRALQMTTARPTVHHQGANASRVVPAGRPQRRLTHLPATPTLAPSAVPTLAPSTIPSPLATATPVPPRPAQTVESIRCTRTASGTTVRIVAAGTLTAHRVHLVRLDDPPRVLVRIQGIRAPYRQPVIPVDSPELARVRIWLHTELKPPELYIVCDLATTDLSVTEHMSHDTLILTISRPHTR